VANAKTANRITASPRNDANPKYDYLKATLHDHMAHLTLASPAST